jgi:hypothetical protein
MSPSRRRRLDLHRQLEPRPSPERVEIRVLFSGGRGRGQAGTDDQPRQRRHSGPWMRVPGGLPHAAQPVHLNSFKGQGPSGRHTNRPQARGFRTPGRPQCPATREAVGWRTEANWSLLTCAAAVQRTRAVASLRRQPGLPSARIHAAALIDPVPFSIWCAWQTGGPGRSRRCRSSRWLPENTQARRSCCRFV